MDPHSLRDVQLWMVGAICGRAVDAASPERLVTAGPHLSAKERLDIYRSAYRARLVECLLDDYPVLAKTIGDREFEALAEAYIERHPSSSPNLNAYGRHMASLCEERRSADLDLPSGFASELAKLEWAIVEVIHAEAAGPLDVAELQASPPERWATARFAASEAVRLLKLDHRVNRHYQSVLDGAPDASAQAREPSATLVYRSGPTVWRMDLTPMMVAVLGPLLAGRTIGQTLAELEAAVSDPGELQELGRSLHVWFREWAGAGLFRRIEWE